MAPAKGADASSANVDIYLRIKPVAKPSRNCSIDLAGTGAISTFFHLFENASSRTRRPPDVSAHHLLVVVVDVARRLPPTRRCMWAPLLAARVVIWCHALENSRALSFGDNENQTSAPHPPPSLTRRESAAMLPYGHVT